MKLAKKNIGTIFSDIAFIEHDLVFHVGVSILLYCV